MDWLQLIATLHPFLANLIAVAAPTPRLAPVMSAAFPFSSIRDIIFDSGAAANKFRFAKHLAFPKPPHRGIKNAASGPSNLAMFPATLPSPTKISDCKILMAYDRI
jgi:hypothetical protein